METFPFGMPVLPLVQKEKNCRQIFVLGVYASAVHARWIDPKGRTVINALAVASEPEIFWRGDNAQEIVESISVPEQAGRLTASDKQLNGPSGRALDRQFLEPLGVNRNDTWLCDLLPVSRMNPNQAKALARAYAPRMQEWDLPCYDLPPVPNELASPERRLEIEGEVRKAHPSIFITLGDKPLQWFTRYFGSKGRLSAYGESTKEYGQLHDIRIADIDMKLLPLVHPRQAGALGAHSDKWRSLHSFWTEKVAPVLL